MPKKKIWANFQRIIYLFSQKIGTMLSKIWVWDPGSGKNLSRIQGSKRHRIPDPDPQHCFSPCVVCHRYTSGTQMAAQDQVLVGPLAPYMSTGGRGL